MSKRDNEKVKLNIVSSLALQIAVILQGMIIPRLILQYFGSGVNGLISSINQFLNFFAVMEGGISGVILSSLYKPIIENDNDRISKVARASKIFLNKLAMGFLVYTFILASIFSAWKKQFDWKYVFFLVLILSATTFMQYYFSLLPELIIRAANKVYVCNIISIVFILGNLIVTIACFAVYPQIHFIKFVSALTYVFQPIFLNIYVKKRYTLNKKSKLDKELLSERWDGFGTNLANIVTTNTDVMVLMFFSSLEMISVYNVYYSIIAALRGLARTLNFGYQAYIGQAYAKGDIEELNSIFAQYELLVLNISGIFYASSIELIVPFVSIYTKGVNDANYNQPLFSIILNLAMVILCFRDPYIQMIQGAGLFRKTARYAYKEAGINIIISIILVRKLGIIGLAVGTLISNIYRMIAIVNFLQDNVLMRNNRVAFRKISIFFIPIIISFILFKNLALSFQIRITEWCAKAFLVVCVNTALYMAVNMIFYRKELKEIKDFFFLKY